MKVQLALLALVSSGAQLVQCIPNQQLPFGVAPADLKEPHTASAYQDASAQQQPELTVEDFSSIERVKKVIESAKNAFVDVVEEALSGLDDDNDSSDNDDDGGGFPKLPHHPPHVIDLSKYTIPQILNWTLHHPPPPPPEGPPKFPPKFPGPPHVLPLHRLAWLVNISSEAQEALGKDGITLLAPDDFALQPPHRRGPPRDHKPDFVASHEQHDGVVVDHSTFHESMMRDIARENEHQPIPHPFHSHQLRKLGKKCAMMKEQSSEDDKKDEEKKEKFAKIVAFILKYHTLPSIKSERELADSSTVATSLNQSRVHVDPIFEAFPFPHPSLKFNGYAKKRGPTVLAKNGVIHLIGAPLLPPFTPLNSLFLFPQFFSTFTSGVQKIDLDDKLLPALVNEPFVAEETKSMMEEVVAELTKETGLEKFTIFTPTNWAFDKLGPKIIALIHSPFPFSRHVLKYVLSYHIVPGITFFSDFIANDTSIDAASAYITKEESDVEVPFEWIVKPGPPPPPRPDEDLHREGERSPSFERRHHDRHSFKDGPPPRPPGRDGPPPHHPHPSHLHANVTHYELPTLLTKENANATLKVLVISHRAFGKGPIRRSIVVLPHGPFGPPPKDDDAGEDINFGKHKHEHRGPPPPKPVRVIFADRPARNGAIHPVPQILRPPYPQDVKLASQALGHGHGKRMHRALEELFA